MKSITIIRHAQASLGSINFTDFDRPLNKTGILESELMGNMLLKQRSSYDKIISSSANRAINTMKIIANQIHYKQVIEEKQMIYNSSEYELIDMITQLDNNLQSIIICGHNPTLHRLSQKLSGQIFHIFPTCSIVKINFDINNWGAIELGDLDYFSYPELLKKNT